MSAKFVVRVEDRADHPTVGRVLGWLDEDRCDVLWGDCLVNCADPDAHARTERMDELTPYRSRLSRSA